MAQSYNSSDETSDLEGEGMARPHTAASGNMHHITEQDGEGR